MARIIRSCGTRNNEFLGDMAAWKRKQSGDNGDQMERIRSCMRKVRMKELTARQAEFLSLHYEGGLSMTEIAHRKGVCISTVSRTIARAKENLRRYLQYSF